MANMTQLNVGDQHEIQLTGLTYSASAVGRINDVVIFVDGGAPNETALVEITAVKKRHCHARIINLISPSPDRIPPPCPYFSVGCGGCQWQHVNVEAQLAAKAGVLTDSLNRIGGLSSLPDITRHPAPQPLGYRNQIRVVVTAFRPQVTFGFKQEKSHDVVPVDRCEVGLPAINRALPQAADLMSRLRLFHVDEFTLRASATTGEVMLILIFPKKHQPRLAFTDEDLLKYPAIHSIYAQSGERGTPVWVAGNRTLVETVGGIRYAVGPNTFFQNNLAGLEQLMGIVRQRVRATPPMIAIDAHCGVGTFTLPIAQTAKAAFGLDLQREAIELAGLNAKTNGITNVSFRVGHLAALDKIHADLFVLDPPRGGCRSEDLEALERIAPRCILYISCNPTTLARDLARLKSNYEIRTLDLVDLFPMTYHFETVVWLQHRREFASRV
ncbi:MAG: 23S rRNA (uracil(1939)-C(5))-methyltransferase RlmD [Candidatus Poribacteria bacterium]|nr:23S rRNA (uracil(1939)-C(5))-methyltransferase RlmD [Candidatus Poribacteria bacterium]